MNSTLAGRLEIEMAMNIARLQTDMAQVKNLIGGMAKSTNEAIAKIQDQFDALGSRAMNALKGIAAGFVSIKAAEAFGDNILDATKMAAELNNVAKKSATTAEELSSLMGVAKQSGASVQTVGATLGSLAKAMYETAAGTGKARDVFHSLGLSVKDSNGQLKPTAAFLQEVAKKLEGMSNETQKLAAAQKMMKGTGADVLEFLEDLANAGKLSATVTNEQAQQAEDYERSLRKLDSAKKALFITISQQVTPVMTAFIRTLVEMRTQVGGLNDRVKKLAEEGAIRQWAVNGALAITLVIDKLLDTAKVVGFVAEVVGTLGSVTWSVFKVIGSAISAASESMNAFGDMLGGVGLILSGQFQAGAEVVSGAWKRIKGTSADAFAGMKAELSGAVQEVSELFESLENLGKSLGKDAYTNAFLAQYAKVLEKVKEVKKVTSDTTIETKFQKDAIDNLVASYQKQIAVLQEQYKHLRMFGVETKATARAELEAQIQTREFAAQLAEHTKRTGESAEAVKARLRALADQKDGLTESIQIEKQYIDALKKSNEAATQSVQVIVDQIEKQKDQNATIGLTVEATTRYTIAKLEAKKADLSNIDGMEDLIAKYDLQISKLKELATLQGNGEAIRNQISVWNEVAERGSRFFADMLDGGKKAFDSLKNMVKDFARELIALFAKKWLLQLGASMVGGSAGSALAGQAASAGEGSIAGSLLGSAGSFLFGSPGAVTSTGLAEPAAAGLFGSGGFMAMFETVGAWMMSNPVTAALAAIVIIAGIFSRKGGGPKDEGQYTAQFGPNGELMGPGATSFNIVGTSANSQAQQFAEGVGKGFFDILKSLGGTSGGFQFGTGIVRDPRGTAPTFVDTAVRDANGNVIFSQHNAQVGRSDEDLQAELTLQSQRAILAALQHSTLPPMVAGILNSIVAETASLDEINAAITEAGRLQAMWTAFQQSFSTDAEKLADAQKIVTDGFKGLGIDVPKDMEGFKALVRKAWADGDKEIFEKLMALGPAFQYVAEQMDVVAQKIQDDWNEVAQLLGRDTGTASSLLTQFEQNNPWANGKTFDQLIADLRTISEEDFKGYSEENRKLIIALLKLADSTEANTEATVAQTQAIVFPEREAGGLIAGFDQKYGGLIGSAPDKMSSLSLASTLMQGQVAQWEAAQKGLSEYSTEFQTLAKAISDMKDRIRLTGIDIARLTVLEAQYGKGKAEQLFDLEKWYKAQQALLEGNSVALDALKTIFEGKWKAIVDGIANSDDGKARFQDWWRGLFFDKGLSPLSLTSQFALAKSDYAAAIASGDLGKIQGSTQTVLELARQLLGSSPAYNAFFQQIAQQTGGLAGISQTEINQRLYGALPSSGTIASGADIAALGNKFDQLIALLAERGLTVKAPAVEDAIEDLALEVRSGSRRGAV